MPSALFAFRGNLKKTGKSTTGMCQIGVRTFCFGGQTVTLKPVPKAAVKKFVPKKLMTASMWRDMLKKTPPKPMKAKAPKERRESMKEVVLRIERVIRVATRDMLEDYCKEYAKEGLPGKKNKPKKIKSKVHEGVHQPATTFGGHSVGFKESARPCHITVDINRFESFDEEISLGSFKNQIPGGICTAFTGRLDYNDPIPDEMLQMPEKQFDEETIEANISVLGEYDTDMEAE